MNKVLKTTEKRYWLFTDLLSSILVLWRWPGKTAGGIVFALIFFASFFYQEKKEDKLMKYQKLLKPNGSFKTD
jgi:hypothetical protein